MTTLTITPISPLAISITRHNVLVSVNSVAKGDHRLWNQFLQHDAPERGFDGPTTTRRRLARGSQPSASDLALEAIIAQEEADVLTAFLDFVEDSAYESDPDDPEDHS